MLTAFSFYYRLSSWYTNFMHNPSQELTFACNLAREAKPIFNKYFGQTHSEWKADNTPLTQADVEINNLIIKRVIKTFPGDTVFGEEASSSQQNGSRVWAIDPIDGTQPFENGIPLSTIAIALIVDGTVQMAVCYDPALDQLYCAEKGKGAYKNDQPIQCNTNNSFAAHYFATSSHFPEGFATTGTVHDRIADEKGKVFNFRSFAYSANKIAEGKLSGAFLGVGRLYDIAAPALLVEEAGGKATDLDGNALDYQNGSNGIIVSNGPLHDTLVDFVQP